LRRTSGRADRLRDELGVGRPWNHAGQFTPTSRVHTVLNRDCETSNIAVRAALSISCTSALRGSLSGSASSKNSLNPRMIDS
jgi:hypothetical protein